MLTISMPQNQTHHQLYRSAQKYHCTPLCSTPPLSEGTPAIPHLVQQYPSSIPCALYCRIIPVQCIIDFCRPGKLRIFLQRNRYRLCIISTFQIEPDRIAPKVRFQFLHSRSFLGEIVTKTQQKSSRQCLQKTCSINLLHPD